MSILPAVSHHGNGHTKWARKLSLFERNPWDLTTIADVASSVSSLAAQFDYFHTRSSAYYAGIPDPAVTLNQSTLQAEVDDFMAGNYGNMRFIFHMISPLTPGVACFANYSTDAHWTTIASNFAKVGTVLNANSKIDGIFWDWEYYGGTNYWFNDANASGLSGTHAQKCATVQTRFKQLMDGLLSTWPDAYITTTHGPSASMSSAYQWFTTDGYHLSYNDTASNNDLMAAAFIGMQEAVYDAGGHACLFDGGTAYPMRTQADARRLQVWQQQRIKTNPNPGSGEYESTLFSNSGMPGKYQVPACLGLFDINDHPSPPDPAADNGFNNGITLPAASVQSMLANAMRQAQGLTWFYTERWDWIDRDYQTPITSDMLNATTEARRLGRL